VPVYTYRVLETFPHDPQAFTQGLVYLGGLLYEGTGLRGRSSLRQVELETGEVLRFKPLPDAYFGEGIAVLDERIYQLTWQSNVGLIYDLATFEQVGQFAYPTEGWGLTHDGTLLIMSDGTATLHFLSPADLSEVRRVTVRDAGQPVIRLNELEYVRGEVWANVWQTDRIARINPDDGKVTGWIDLSGLLPTEDRTGQVDVLNGIAYDADGGRIFVTGKLWPKLFRIEVVPVE
jgi:glutamine cyclotransferase